MHGSYLLTRASGGPFLTFTLTPGTHVLGRSKRCHLVVRDISVSRQHAQIQVDGDGVSVQDLDSRNGTFVNDTRITSGKLLEGQQVRFGSVPFLLAQAGGDDPVIDSAMQTAPLKASTASAHEATEELSAAQRRVLDLLLGGLAEKEIAVRLKLSPHTIHNHVRAIYQVFDVHSRPELFARLMRGKE